MPAARAIVSGGSIAGLSAAFWLRRTGWDVTVIERAPAFRDGGQNVDVRGVARQVLDRMGLFGAVEAQNTTETGTVIVDDRGEVQAELPSDGADGATAELEVLRGDLARIVHDALPGDVGFVYGDTIETVDDGPGEVRVATASGRSLTADLLIVAEGVRSSTRDLLFPDAVDTDELGITMVFGTIPRTDGDDDRWRWHNTVGGRQMHLRPDNHGTTRAILSYAGDDDDLTALDRPEALTRLRDRYVDAGWEAPRILDGFDAADDLYIDRLAQIRMDSWHRGRIVLAGDAAWCVTPIGGGGASLALTSGHVLAAFLASEADPDEALGAYEAWLRPLVDDVQRLPPGIDRFAYPRTRFGLAVRGLLDAALTSKPLAPVAARLTRVAETDRPLPPVPAGAG